MTFDDKLKRAIDSLTTHLHDEISRKTQQISDELALSAQAERQDAEAEAAKLAAAEAAKRAAEESVKQAEAEAAKQQEHLDEAVAEAAHARKELDEALAESE